MPQNILQKQHKSLLRQRIGYFLMDKSVAWFQPSRACFSATEDKNEGEEAHRQAATDGGHSKGLAQHLKGGKTAFGDFLRILKRSSHSTFSKCITLLYKMQYFC